MNHLNAIQRVKDKILELVAINFLTVMNFKICYDVSTTLGINWERTPSTINVIYWIKPPPNFYKLNVDGVLSESLAGYGGLIRDSSGHLTVAFAGSVPNGNADTTLLASILYDGEDVCCNPNLSYNVREIKRLLLFMNSSFYHARKGGNSCASWLANWVCRLSYFTDVIQPSIPEPFNGLLYHDACGVLYVVP
ncbi:uncharacterized protein LOC110108641 [Dendrobium catenatum]|uniref:uncharacterized protein LOC110108641 n=1 Tax=Dendrobium catenatum TaxID=906689 RepID=UPI0009F3D3B1|nr:uncharacterized protein LOC110108641 [Dendrobium catenatum]